VAERKDQRAPEPLVQPLVVERMIPPATPAPAEAVSASSATEQESRAALEPVAPQIVIERIVAPAAPALRVEDRFARRRTAWRDEEPEAEGKSSRSPSIVAPLSPDKRPGPAAVVAQPRVEPAQRIEPPPAAPAEPTPTIQVTIGRVEIRATSPPVPAPKKQRPKPAVMSLDEYLRQRANGGDR
jgi:hypothetical protein